MVRAKRHDSDATQGIKRRPSGEPAPLPREPLAGSGKIWIGLGIFVVGVLALLISPTDFFLGTGEWWDRIDKKIMGYVPGLRTDPLTDLSQLFDELRSTWLISLLRWGTIFALIVVRRWRHLFVFVGAFLVVEPLVVAVSNRLARPRPDAIQVLTDWSGFSQPSLPMAMLALTLIGMIYALVPPGQSRLRALLGASLVLTLVALSRVYLGVEHVTDAASAIVLGVTVPLVAFRVVAPDAVFPVAYDRRKTAHLDMGGPRREAILESLSQQLGFDAVDVELFGLEGSGGSTPLRVSLAGSQPRYVFAKLYAQNHLRSDRWYKLGRSLLYGALEDESPFQTVRRLAEHEDHVMRLMKSGGVPCPDPLGLIEITPGREYLLVTEFLEGGQEISDAEVDADVVKDCLAAVQAMWAAGLAHRDLKPANILVAQGKAYVIDHAFGEIRPSPWRQAVDLANMILSLSLRTDPQLVYDEAMKEFSEVELSEAFAATHGVTLPSELRHRLKEDKRELLDWWKANLPDRKPIRIQRWTRRRITALIATGVAIGAAGWLVVVNWTVVGGLL